LHCDNISAELKITVNSQLKFIVTVYYLLQHVLSKFNIYGSVRRKYIPIYIQQDATVQSPFISGNCSTCFGWYLNPSSGVHTTVSTASGICQTVTATCRYSHNIATHNIRVSWPLSIKFGAEEPYSQTPSVNVPPPRWQAKL
jgi:hypothetical protein